MEGIGQNKIYSEENGEGRQGETSPESWRERIEKSQKSVVRMFDEKMETTGLIRRILERGVDA